MAELNRDQRFLPCLLDRLRDDEPKKREESRNDRVISISAYKRGVVRDLQWLFNTSAPIPADERLGETLERYPHAAKSVLNYGLRQLCGLLAPDVAALQKEISEALKCFEPRVIRHTVDVRASLDRHLIDFTIKALLYAEPVPEQLFVQTTIDMENGQCVLGDRGNG
jgi:type VI secretion system protein ImpF